MLISQSVFFIFSCILGLVLKCFFESISFYVMFQAIRKFAGGYHADTEILCEIMSSLSIATCIIIIKLSYTYDFSIYLFCTSIISAVAIFILCPIDTPEKPLTDKEFKYFRKVARSILIIILTIITVTFIFKWKLLFASSCLSLILESILLIAGKIKRAHRKARCDNEG